MFNHSQEENDFFCFIFYNYKNLFYQLLRIQILSLISADCIIRINYI